ncbi:MAG: transcriptional regulator PpsR [Burkholderiales bacterium]
MNRPEAFQQSFSSLGAEETASLIAAAADVALLVDDQGVIRDVSIGNSDLAEIPHDDWIGKRWSETVTVESRPKVEALLADVGGGPAQRWRHVNHPSGTGADVPMMYSAIQMGGGKSFVAIGRDMRPLATIQQRLIAAQQSMERDYLRLRQLETRYRALFQSVSEGVLIVDATTLKVVEANPAAAVLLDETPRRLVGRALPECFDATSRPALQTLLDAARTARQAEDTRLAVAGVGRETTVSASLFRQDSTSLFLVRIAPPAPELDTSAAPTRRAVLTAVDRAPDALAVTDPAGRVLYANAAFAAMAQMDTPDQVVGEPLDRWLGRAGVDLGVLIATLRQNDAVRLFPTIMRGRFGGETTVEISATAVPGDTPCLGFTIRDVGRRLPAEGRSTQGLQRTVGHLTELVGRVPLKDIVGETTDMIEQLCIEAALQLTRDNRAAAAEMLGLSRQSLYVKLRRYGLGDYAPDGSAGER